MQRVLLLLFLTAGMSMASTYRMAETLELDTVPSWFPVGFCLLTHGNDQYAAYYNEKHEMIVAKRRLDQKTWQKTRLPSKVGWDSHNDVTMAVDLEGNLHLSGNMHCVPAGAFRHVGKSNNFILILAD
jgi:hypothetical protein